MEGKFAAAYGTNGRTVNANRSHQSLPKIWVSGIIILIGATVRMRHHLTSAAIFRFCTLPMLSLAMCASLLLTVGPTFAQDTAGGYRMSLRNKSGQVSLPDETGKGKKTYFIDLAKAGQTPVQMFGGPSGDRFKVVSYDEITATLVCEEVETKTRINLEVGKQVVLGK